MTEALAVTHGYADVGDAVLHYVTAGSGPPVVLIHGWPMTWWSWRGVIPLLTRRYTVIAPDMRGLGDSSRPHSGYDKKTIAADIWRLVHDKLGHRQFYLAGHDWGGPTAFALAAAHRAAVRRLAIIDVVIPGDGGDFSQGGRRWHHQFHNTPDLPEALVQGREDIYLGWFYRTFAFRPDATGPDDVAEYLRTYRQPGAMRASFEFYRALERDAADNAAEIATHGPLAMPVLAIGGGVGYPHSRGRGTEPEQSLRRVATNVRGLVIPDCGHQVPEEQPEILADALERFFAEDNYSG